MKKASQGFAVHKQLKSFIDLLKGQFVSDKLVQFDRLVLIQTHQSVTFYNKRKRNTREYKYIIYPSHALFSKERELGFSFEVTKDRSHNPSAIEQFHRMEGQQSWCRMNS
ncbi:hypothetical protein HAX54_017466 [Datura stramonium]|uniref:Uncharacterized protein n=1 Tax=Datura stramonium TaxID=4076 RepID=A0ABS8Y4J3_DATST|nr:hypothetical protein [Datura stramonium]